MSHEIALYVKIIILLLCYYITMLKLMMLLLTIICVDVVLSYRKNKERAKRNKLMQSRKTPKNFRREVQEQKLKEDNLVCL